MSCLRYFKILTFFMLCSYSWAKNENWKKIGSVWKLNSAQNESCITNELYNFLTEIKKVKKATSELDKIYDNGGVSTIYTPDFCKSLVNLRAVVAELGVSWTQAAELYTDRQESKEMESLFLSGYFSDADNAFNRFCSRKNHNHLKVSEGQALLEQLGKSIVIIKNRNEFIEQSFQSLSKNFQGIQGCSQKQK